MTSYKDELRHYGIKGQKRGKRRFQNEDGSLTAAGRARYGVSKGDNRHGILSVSDQRAGGGPQTKGKLSGAPVQRTKEMSSKTMSKEERMKRSGTSSASTNVYVNGQKVGHISKEYSHGGGAKIVVSDRKDKDGLGASYNDLRTGEQIRYTRTDPRRGVVRNDTYVDTSGTKRWNGEIPVDVFNKKYTHAGKHEVLKGGKLIENRTAPRYRGENDPRAQAVAAQRANAGVRTSAHNPREMSMGAARTTRNVDGSTSRRTDNGDVVFERKRKDGTTEVIRQSGRGDTRTVVGRNGTTRESYKVVGEDDIRNKRTERGLKGEKHEVVKASKGGQSAKSTGKPTGVAAVGKTASKQLSSVMGKVRSMAAKEAVKKGAVVKKKKKG